MARRDPHAAALLQVPLAYPGADDQSDAVLATGAAAARRPPRRSPQRPPGPRANPPPRRARTLTPEQQVTRETLATIVVQTPAGARVAADAPLACVATVEWKDPTGKLVPWDPAKIKIRFGSNRAAPGPGPVVFRPTYVPQTLVVDVDLWSERGGEWRSVNIYKQTIAAFCPVDMGDWLSDDEKHIVATLFSEGGSDANNMSRDELIRVMWCIQHRVDLLRKLKSAVAADAQDELARSRLSFARGRGWGKDGTYAAVLTKAQFSGINTPQYKIALDPAAEVRNEVECKRLQMTIDIVFGVLTAAIADPDAGQGNAFEPGCFYYMTKDKYNANVAWNAANPTKKQKFAPSWPKLPTTSTDKHFYWGIEPDGPFRP